MRYIEGFPLIHNFLVFIHNVVHMVLIGFQHKQRPKSPDKSQLFMRFSTPLLQLLLIYIILLRKLSRAYVCEYVTIN